MLDDDHVPLKCVFLPYRLCDRCYNHVTVLLDELQNTRQAVKDNLNSFVEVEPLRFIVWQYLYRARPQCPYCC